MEENKPGQALPPQERARLCLSKCDCCNSGSIPLSIKLTFAFRVQTNCCCSSNFYPRGPFSLFLCLCYPSGGCGLLSRHNMKFAEFIGYYLLLFAFCPCCFSLKFYSTFLPWKHNSVFRDGFSIGNLEKISHFCHTQASLADGQWPRLLFDQLPTSGRTTPS